MGQRPRPRPEHLPAKLLAIRHALNATQGEIAFLVGVTTPRVHEYEKGKREPNLLTLMAYARIAGVLLDRIVDDSKELTLMHLREE